jgi:hypothetical protein
MNLYPEVVESQTGKNKIIDKRTPGITDQWTLPTTPVRALWAGEQRLFAVGGINLFELLYSAMDGYTYVNRTSAGTVTTVGTAVAYVSGDNFTGLAAGDPITINGVAYTIDTVTSALALTLTATAGTQSSPVDYTFGNSVKLVNDGNPAQIIANGNQLLVISGGLAYCDEGFGPLQVAFSTDTGYVDTNGTAVKFDTGDNFSNVSEGNQILINSVLYVVLTVSADGNSLVLTTSAGIQSSAPWSDYALNGTVYTIPNDPTAGQSTVYQLGTGNSPFTVGMTAIVISGTSYPVVSVISGTQLVITGVLNMAGVPFAANSNVTASSGTFLDGYFIVSQPNSKLLNLSALDDGTTWSGLDVATKEGYPDNIASLKADHEQLWILGDEVSTEVWQDTGNANFPLQRIPGAFVQWGCAAPFSLVRLGAAVAWLGLDQERGGVVAYMAQGYAPMRVSNHAVEAKWGTYTTVNDAVGYTYIEDGHEIWVLNFPTANATWSYDATESALAGMQLWHERGWWNGSSIDRQRGVCHAYVPLAGLATVQLEHYVGDWQNGNVYVSSVEIFNDNGVPIHRIRTCPHIANEDLRQFFSLFQLMAQVNDGGVLNPILDYSVDYGQNFVNPQTRTSDQPGVTDQYQTRLLWRRLGDSRDRVFRVTITDSADFALVDGYYYSTPGVS